MGSQRIANMTLESYDNKTNQQDSNLFYIFYNGKVTENDYFKSLVDALAHSYRNKARSQFIIRKFANGSPLQVVAKAERVINSKKNDTDTDTVWLVFDKDDFDEQNNQYTDAIILALGKSMKVAYSNVCFELWLLLHFEDVNDTITKIQLKDRLNGIKLRHSDKLINENDKYFPFGLLNRHGDRDAAITRSNLLETTAQTQNPQEPWNVNPVTMVHHLIEDLKNFVTPSIR